MECTTAWFVMVYMSTDAFLICPKPKQDMIMAEYNAEQLRRLCRYLSMSLRQIGDALDLVRDE